MTDNNTRFVENKALGRRLEESQRSFDVLATEKATLSENNESNKAKLENVNIQFQDLQKTSSGLVSEKEELNVENRRKIRRGA